MLVNSWFFTKLEFWVQTNVTRPSHHQLNDWLIRKWAKTNRKKGGKGIDQGWAAADTSNTRRNSSSVSSKMVSDCKNAKTCTHFTHTRARAHVAGGWQNLPLEKEEETFQLSKTEKEEERLVSFERVRQISKMFKRISKKRGQCREKRYIGKRRASDVKEGCESNSIIFRCLFIDFRISYNKP